MDFSFVEEAGRPIPQHPPPSGQPARPLLQLPTWQEVQAAKQPSSPTILFRPTGLVAAARQQQQQQQQQEQQQQPPRQQYQQGQGGPPPAAAPAYAPGAPSGAPWPPGPAGAGHQAAPAWQAPGPAAAAGPGPSGAYPGVASFGGGGGSGGAGSSNGGAAGGHPGVGAGAGGPPRSAPWPQGAARPSSGYVGQQAPAGGVVPAPPPNVVLVNRRQQGNPVLKHIRNVRWQFADIVTDYQLGQNTAALFLSLRYHLLHPEYILHRIREQQRLFRLTVLLVHVDVDDVVKPLGEVTRAAVVGDCTLVCAWSPEECARWLETYKSYESKPASAIQEKVDPDYVSRLAAVLAGSVRGINRTDAHTLGTSFGSLAAMMRCSDPDTFSACPGIGPTKVRRLMEAFHEPFRKQLKMTGAAGSGPSSAPGARTVDAAAVGPEGPRRDAGGSAAGRAASTKAAAATAGTEAHRTGIGAAAGASRAGSMTADGAAARQGSAAEAPAGPSRSLATDRGEHQGGEWEDGEGPEGGSSDMDAAEQGEGGPQAEEGAPSALGGVPGSSSGPNEARRQHMLELLMSQMPAGDDDVSDGDEDYRL